MPTPSITRLPRGRLLVALCWLVLAVLLVGLGIAYGRPIWAVMNNPQRLQEELARLGIWAPLGLIAAQVLQVVFAPLPGNLVAIAAGYMFGLGKGLLFAMIGVVLGSAVAFLLARLVGRQLLSLVIPGPLMNRFDHFVARRGPFVVFLLLLVPNPVGDWVYYLAGLTILPLPIFLGLVLLGRIPSNLLETMLGAELLRLGSPGRHLTGWQIAIAAIAAGAAILVYYLNRHRLETLMMRLVKLPPDTQDDRT
ncbi:MAG: VTT domain-containing protein [candidate division WOR-3 bacterium]